MAQATFQFFGDLNFFLPRRRKQTTFTHTFDHTASIKDMIESLGVPHPEINVILINGESVDFNVLVADGDSAEVYPFFEAPPHVAPLIHLRPAELSQARFVLDVHLGKLANLLRMLGFDTLYRNDYEDDELAEISQAENRILLSRDLGVLKRGIVDYGYYPRNKDPQEQLLELIHRYDLVSQLHPFKRCMACNGLLHKVDKADVLAHIPRRTVHFFDEFRQCTACEKVYWRGSHFEKMQQHIESMLNIKLDDYHA